jgi:hypothetical protein
VTPVRSPRICNRSGRRRSYLIGDDACTVWFRARRAATGLEASFAAQGFVYLCASREASWHQVPSAIVDGLKTRGVSLDPPHRCSWPKLDKRINKLAGASIAPGRPNEPDTDLTSDNSAYVQDLSYLHFGFERDSRLLPVLKAIALARNRLFWLLNSRRFAGRPAAKAAWRGR